MRIAHLSDIHLDTTGLRPWHLLDKRFTGAVNLMLGRSSRHRSSVVAEALQLVRSLDCEHIVVTGDLTNLSIALEFFNARKFLDDHIDLDASQLHVVPGNHDRYTPDASVLRSFEKHFAPYIESDLPELTSGATWPYVKLYDEVAIIGLDSSIPLPPFMAGGWIGGKQRKRTAAILEHPEVKRRYSVVLLHHHLFKPSNRRGEFPRHLFDKRPVLDMLVAGGANLVLHGHNHWYGFRQIQDTLICEAGSSSITRSEDPRGGGKFNIYHLEHGVLTGFDTYLYHEDEGFSLWKSWSVGVYGPALSEG